MRVLCIHPRDDYNIGDLMTFYGSKYLLRRAFGDVEFLQFDSRRAEREIETYIPEYNWGDDVEMILLAGSPWVSPVPGDAKLRQVRQAKERWPGAKRVALGIGSCFRGREVVKREYGMGKGEDLRQSLATFRDFDFVMVRDPITRDILQDAGIHVEYFYDTSIFSYRMLWHGGRKRQKNILVYMDPLANDMWDHLPKVIWEKYVQFQIEWAKLNDAEIFAVSSGDKASADRRGLECRFVCDLEWMASIMARALAVLSPKVHQCILAAIMGCLDVQCIPVDSRYFTALNIGAKLAQPSVSGIMPFADEGIKGVWDQLDEYLFPGDGYSRLKFNWADLQHDRYEKPIVDKLRNVLAGEGAW